MRHALPSSAPLVDLPALLKFSEGNSVKPSFVAPW